MLLCVTVSDATGSPTHAYCHRGHRHPGCGSRSGLQASADGSRYIAGDDVTQRVAEDDARLLLEQTSPGDPIMQTSIDRAIESGKRQGEAEFLLRLMELKFGPAEPNRGHTTPSLAFPNLLQSGPSAHAWPVLLRASSQVLRALARTWSGSNGQSSVPMLLREPLVHATVQRGDGCWHSLGSRTSTATQCFGLSRSLETTNCANGRAQVKAGETALSTCRLLASPSMTKSITNWLLMRSTNCARIPGRPCR